MLAPLRAALEEACLENSVDERASMSMANLALWMLLKRSFFTQSHADVRLWRDGDRWEARRQVGRKDLLVGPSLPGFSNWERPSATAQLAGDHTPISVDVALQAQALLSTVLSRHPAWEAMLSDPAAPARRHDLAVEVLDEDGLSARLSALLGPTHDASLASEGLLYHEPPSWSDPPWRFVLAHNGMEVAGILGIYESPQAFVLSHVSVAPGFRARGVSVRLYERALDLCEASQRLLLRSTPSDFTQANPAITARYDALLHDRPVLHLCNAGFLEKTLVDGLAQWGHDRVFPLAKPVCDARLEVDPSRLDEWDRAQALALRAAFQALPSVSKAPRIR